MREKNPLIGKTEKEIHRLIIESNIKVANMFSSLITSTFGPVGLHKIIVDEDNFIIVTRDGRTILQNTHTDHPIEGLLLELAKSQDEEAGDGTTSAVILAAELLNKALSLMSEGLHPTTIIEGYRLAAKEGIKAMEELAVPIKNEGEKKKKEILRRVTKTALNNKHFIHYKNFFAEMVVEAVLRTVDFEKGEANANTDNIYLERVQGKGLRDSEVYEGLLIETRIVMPGMPTHLKNCKVALLDADLSAEAFSQGKLTIGFNLKDPEQIERNRYSYSLLKDTMESIAASGVNVLINHKGIDSIATHFFAEKGIIVLRDIKMENIKKIARLVGAKIVSDPASLFPSDLGHADEVEERKIGDFYFVVVHKKNAKVVTLLMRGGTKQVVDEVYRTIHDAVHTTVNAFNSSILPGGGAIEVEIAHKLRKYALTDKTRRQFSILAFADSLEVVAKTLAKNSGLDPLLLLLELRSEHSKGRKYYGLDVNTTEIADMMERGIIEPLKMKIEIIKGTMGTVQLILRSDDYIPKKGLKEIEEDLIKADIMEAVEAGKVREDIEEAYREAIKWFGREHVKDAIKLQGWEKVKKVTEMYSGKKFGHS